MNLLNENIDSSIKIFKGLNLFTQADLMSFINKNFDHPSFVEWDFGPVMHMKYDSKAKNYLFSDERVPLHWDGAFFKEPRFLIFSCLESNGEGGETTYVDTYKLLESLTLQEREELAQIECTYACEKLAHYGGEFTSNLISLHPTEKKDILRLAQAVSSHKNPVTRNFNKTDSILEKVENLLEDERFKKSHLWEKGDVLIIDNHRYLHGRNPLGNNIKREFLRVQVA